MDLKIEGCATDYSDVIKRSISEMEKYVGNELSALKYTCVGGNGDHGELGVYNDGVVTIMQDRFAKNKNGKLTSNAKKSLRHTLFHEQIHSIPSLIELKNKSFKAYSAKEKETFTVIKVQGFDLQASSGAIFRGIEEGAVTYFSKYVSTSDIDQSGSDRYERVSAIFSKKIKNKAERKKAFDAYVNSDIYALSSILGYKSPKDLVGDFLKAWDNL